VWRGSKADEVRLGVLGMARICEILRCSSNHTCSRSPPAQLLLSLTQLASPLSLSLMPPGRGGPLVDLSRRRGHWGRLQSRLRLLPTPATASRRTRWRRDSTSSEAAMVPSRSRRCPSLRREDRLPAYRSMKCR
jgi:hypothetical protein